MATRSMSMSILTKAQNEFPLDATVLKEIQWVSHSTTLRKALSDRDLEHETGFHASLLTCTASALDSTTISFEPITDSLHRRHGSPKFNGAFRQHESPRKSTDGSRIPTSPVLCSAMKLSYTIPNGFMITNVIPLCQRS